MESISKEFDELALFYLVGERLCWRFTTTKLHLFKIFKWLRIHRKASLATSARHSWEHEKVSIRSRGFLRYCFASYKVLPFSDQLRLRLCPCLIFFNKEQPLSSYYRLPPHGLLPLLYLSQSISCSLHRLFCWRTIGHQTHVPNYHGKHALFHSVPSMSLVLDRQLHSILLYGAGFLLFEFWSPSRVLITPFKSSNTNQLIITIF